MAGQNGHATGRQVFAYARGQHLGRRHIQSGKRLV
jgi:hypothetical protein